MFGDGRDEDDGVVTDAGVGKRNLGKEYLLASPILGEEAQSFRLDMDKSPTLGDLEPSSGTDTTATTPSWQFEPSPLIPAEQNEPTQQPPAQLPAQLATIPTGLTLPKRHKRKPVPRKGHTKSRKGCLNCKRRKVKCQETRPECGHCKKMGLSCEWPSDEKVVARPGGRLALAAVRRVGPASDAGMSLGRSMGTAGYAVRSGATFNIQDMHFFQHFLTMAYPPLPLDGSEVWKGVSAMAHHYDFLIHAMLGLGASHLNLCGSEPCARPALMHRIAAMKSLNAFLSRGQFSKEDGDAAFAAAMSLTFQSTYMEDGLVDFLAMVRGCYIIAVKTMPDFHVSAFRNFSREGHVAAAMNLAKKTKRVPTPPNIDALIEQFCQSIMNLGPILASPAELNIMADIHTVARVANSDLQAAHHYMSGAYNRFGIMTNDEFSAFTDPQNYAAKLLMVHFFLVDYVLGTSSVDEVRLPTYEKRKAMAMSWINGLLTSLPDRYEKYAGWVLSFTRTTMLQLHELYGRNGDGDGGTTVDLERADCVREEDVALSQDDKMVTTGKADMTSDMFADRPSDSEV